MKGQFDPDHVLASCRPDLASGAACVTVEVSPSDPTDGKKFEVKISASALPNRYATHVLAWAAGYYVIQQLGNAQLVPNEQLWIGSAGAELGQRIDAASAESEAHLAAQCPQPGCHETVVLPNSQIFPDQPPPPEEDATLTCGKGHRFQAKHSDLRVYVKAFPPLLLRGTAAT